MNFALVNDKRTRKQKKNFLGITLVELALVIAVLAILSFGAFVIGSGILDSARKTNIQKQLVTIRKSIKLIYQDTECYPINFNFFFTGIASDAQNCGGGGTRVKGWNGPYLQSADIKTGGIIGLDSLVPGTIIEIEQYTNGGKNKLRLLLSNTGGGVSIVREIADTICGKSAATKDDLSVVDYCFYDGSGNLYFYIGHK